MNGPIVPIIYARELVDLLQKEGVPVREALRGTGISARQLRMPDGLITHPQQLRVYQNAVAIASEPGLGFRLGALFEPGHHGVLGHALLCATSGRDELRIAANYVRIRGFLLDFELREEADTTVLVAREFIPLGAVHMMVVEELLAMFSGPGSSRSSEASEIRIDYPAPAHRAQYESLFECPIRFGADALEIRFPNALLDAPREMSNAEMLQICEERCQAILERLGSGGQMADRVRSQILAIRGFQLDAVAGRMGTSPRTLRRRLREEGTNFREVVGDVRKGLALDYLETSDLLLEEIAALLGYEDAANFNRAFRRWVGRSPARHRRKFREDVAS
ncbi:MAG: AraC family transcriptional regulator [Myxococcales bacterium]|nr:AraC family transcriptional regulator [Myxococcales bacterium]HIL79646.1 AraC family transcriptional regulator [Myxococcales bacterium]